jgi:hypothetical protein
MLNRIFAAVVAIGLLYAGAVQAMTSTNFTIGWDSINSGGDDVSSSTNYRIRDTVGEQGTGVGTSTNFTLSAGYRTADESPISLSFSIGTQENDTQTTFSAFSNGGSTVTVAATSSFAVGDLIGVVENSGLSQIIAVGEITDISGAVMTVDDWDGSPASISGSPAGADDYVYRLGGTTAALGTVNVSTGSTSLTGTRVTSDSANGYTVYVSDDGNLRTGAADIDDVLDGTVTAGEEEYGWRVFGTSATSTGSDLAFLTSTIAIQATSSVALTEQRVGLVYKASVSSTTEGGSFSHVVYYTLTANY